MVWEVWNVEGIIIVAVVGIEEGEEDMGMSILVGGGDEDGELWWRMGEC